MKRFIILVAVGTLGLLPFLIPYLRYSFSNDLYSHLILIPLVSGYLVWIKKREGEPGEPLRLAALVAFLLFIGSLAVRLGGGLAQKEDIMAATGLSYVLFIWSAALYSFGRAQIRAHLFPLCLLLAMVPFPVVVENAIESVLQHGSAECAYWMFRIAGTTVYREGLVFHLPSITMEVAPQCSGIRSSLVLFIVSLVGGQMFLNSNWRRLVLVLVVLPLALLRNGFRVFTLGELCEKIGPHMIDSWVHHRGGPIFFALSLIPFMGLVWWLMRGEAKAQPRSAKSVG